jgi:hypothetical protein
MEGAVLRLELVKLTRDLNLAAYTAQTSCQAHLELAKALELSGLVVSTEREERRERERR